jgi:sugar fermentation stimulation protein A
MEYSPALTPATLLRRYKRFLADVELVSGQIITVHTPNTGAMTGCADPGSRVFLRKVDNPKRKYPISWEMTENLQGVMVGVHTGITNTLVKEGILCGVSNNLQGCCSILHEVEWGEREVVSFSFRRSTRVA